MSIEVEKPLHVVELNIWRLFEHQLNSTFLEKEKTDCCWPIRQMRNITSQKCLRLTSAKLQAATQANTPSFRPSPSYPLALIIKPVGLVPCKYLSKRMKMRSWPLQHYTKDLRQRAISVHLCSIGLITK